MLERADPTGRFARDIILRRPIALAPQTVSETVKKKLSRSSCSGIVIEVGHERQAGIAPVGQPELLPDTLDGDGCLVCGPKRESRLGGLFLASRIRHVERPMLILGI